MNRLEKIENVILFGSFEEGYFHTDEELKTLKEDDYTYSDYFCLACNENKYNKYVISKSGVRYTLKDGTININDTISGTSFSLSKENTKNTIIFQGQNNTGTNVSYNGLISAFEQLGFLIINPIQSIEIASNKFLSSSLLSVHNIPQPNYVVVSKKDIFDNDDNIKETFFPYLHSIYQNYPNVNNEETKFKYVVKTLDGSLGIGVFLCDEDEILSILQTMFTVDENTYLIIQEFKNNTGDIRAHVFSFDKVNYEIIAAMKRNKIKGDFRSNVSLGGTTSKIDLTDEQKKIILDTAKASGCYWVGVDLMDCEDESGNKENVVIEYNSSPGVEGISKQIKKNMFSIIFEKITKNLKPIKENKETNISTINEDTDVEDVETYEGNYFIKNIVLFSKSDDINKNDGAAYISKFAEVNNIKTYFFTNSELEYEEIDNGIIIRDSNVEFNIKESNKKDTLVITRASIVESQNAIDACNKLQEMGFFILNPIEQCLLANDKYRMKELFESYSIPHPRTIKISNNDIKDNPKEDLNNILTKIYNKPSDSSKYVLKILDGHSGQGVAICDGSNILGILQMFFAIDPEREILVQEFVKGKNGDLRVHVLTTKTTQTILCSMKRNKLEDDFRSNVSLGATAEKIDLTPEQESLACRIATISKLPWCAVDIMELENKSLDGYTNVAIEFNDSPGLGGISHSIGKNIINVLLDNIKKEDL